MEPSDLPIALVNASRTSLKVGGAPRQKRQSIFGGRIIIGSDRTPGALDRAVQRVGVTVKAIERGAEDDRTPKDRAYSHGTLAHIPFPQLQLTTKFAVPMLIQIDYEFEPPFNLNLPVH